MGRSGLHALAYAAVIYVIVLEFPQLGVIRVDDIDQVLVDARQAIN